MQISPEAIRARAEALAAEGRLEEAAGAYRELVAHTPFEPGALVGLARVLRAKGDVDGAINRYEAALRVSKNHPGVAFELVSAQLGAGKVDDAERVARKTVQAHPSHAGAHLLLAQALMHGKDPRRALAEIARARRIDPRLVEAIALQGTLHAMLQEHAEAEACFRDALAQDAGHAGLRTNLAHSLKAQSRYEDAVTEYRAALSADPGLSVALGACADSLGRLGRVGEGIELVEQALERTPGDPHLHHALGNLFQDEGRLEDAAKQQELALAALPGFGDAAYNLGMVEIDLGRWDRAAAAMARALSADPASKDNHLQHVKALHFGGSREAALQAVENAGRVTGDADFEVLRGHFLRDAGRFEEAVGAYRQVLAAPAGASLMPRWDAHAHVALNLLTLGRLAEGWQEYMQRIDRGAEKLQDPRIVQDPATFFASAAATGETVLADDDQGIGDQLFFMRFARAAAQKCARLVLRPAPKLRALLRNAGGAYEIADDLSAAAGCTSKIWFGDLPIAAEPVYLPPFRLQPRPDLVEQVRAQLAGCGPAPYIGVTWGAGVTVAQALEVGIRQHKKGVDPAALGNALRGSKGTVVVLQRGFLPTEGAAFCAALRRDAFDFEAFADDMERMLALLSLLDDYVAVSNTNVHLLAGLEGRRARVLVPFPPEWRWQSGPGPSPWFPGFDVYRQAAGGDWSEPLRALASALGVGAGAGVAPKTARTPALVPVAAAARHSRAHPSERYQRLMGAYSQLHEMGDPKENIEAMDMFPGQSLPAQAGRILRMVQRSGARSLLDYGSGKGLQYEWRDLVVQGVGLIPSIKEYWGVESIRCFDPGFAPLSALPEGKYDGVICTDVLEHCPEEDLEWIVSELFSYAGRFVFANVASYPARKFLPTGENAHITQRPPEYWEDLFRRTGLAHPEVDWEVYVTVQGLSGSRIPVRLSRQRAS